MELKEEIIEQIQGTFKKNFHFWLQEWGQRTCVSHWLLCVAVWDNAVHLVHSEEATEIIRDIAQHWAYQSHNLGTPQKLHMEGPSHITEGGRKGKQPANALKSSHSNEGQAKKLTWRGLCPHWREFMEDSSIIGLGQTVGNYKQPYYSTKCEQEDPLGT